jgi:hypothetical protein
MTGKPISDAATLASDAQATRAAASASSGRVPRALSYSATTRAPFHDMHGTPAFWAMMVLPILSPRARMGGPAGPTNAMGGSLEARALGRAGFSDACPHPAHTAWTPCRRASSTMRVTLA